MEIASSYFGELTIKEAAQLVKLIRVIASIKLVKKGVLLVVGQYGGDFRRQECKGRVLCHSMGHGFYISVERCTINYELKNEKREIHFKVGVYHGLDHRIAWRCSSGGSCFL